ncbi:hypothetical protein SAMN02745172_03568 [Pseudoxanthobacter soli DSM 19599]|uniref:Uncharacterized protein n=1 Tax=Pseudoxanthobacter soli DSM 19599 TaxID=1123029 RepID=A0A1M7ZQH8_9HYPH|nr:hypothetical protein SAMN02745172_03568 [Pseudoxanthobacter soli DSM 19599]
MRRRGGSCWPISNKAASCSPTKPMIPTPSALKQRNAAFSPMCRRVPSESEPSPSAHGSIAKGTKSNASSNRIKQMRGLATRYDRRPENFLATQARCRPHLDQYVMSPQPRMLWRRNRTESCVAQDPHRLPVDSSASATAFRPVAWALPRWPLPPCRSLRKHAGPGAIRRTPTSGRGAATHHHRPMHAFTGTRENWHERREAADGWTAGAGGQRAFRQEARDRPHGVQLPLG